MTRLPTLSSRGASTDPGDGYLEQGLRVPITSRPAWIALRSAALVAAAIAVSLVSAIEHNVAVAWVLLAAAALQPSLLLVPSHRNTGALQAMADCVTITIVVLLAPVLWSPAMVWLGATTAWQAIASPTKVVVPLGVISVAVTTITGIEADVPYWWMATIIVATMCIAFAVLGRQLRHEFRDQEQDLSVAIARAGAIVHQTDLTNSMVRHVNGDIETLTGWTREEWCTLDHRSIIHPDDVDAYWIAAEDARAGIVLDRSWRVRRPDGRWVWLRDVSRISADRKGRKVLRGFTLDVTALEEANRTIAAHARLDSLTGLPNRLALNERLDECVAADLDFALMVIDLDRFKDVNDTLGHEAGDTLLVVLAERIARAVGPDGVVARLGGDEFAILLEQVSTVEQVEAIVDRVSIECSQPLSVAGVRVATSFSIGVAFGGAGNDDREAVLRHADIAMYAAKRSGSTFRVFDASLERSSTVQLTLSATLPDAIAAGEFELHFQPKIDLESHRVVGAEGLARWNHPEHGLLGPESFLDVATMSDSASVFSRTMIEQGVLMARRLIDAGRPLKIAVNVTMRALQDDDFSPWLFAVLGRNGVAPNWLVLEISERDVRAPSSSHAASTLSELTAAGIDLSIDDFGTGHSSMQRLRELNVAELKIDRSFVEGIAETSVDREIVRSIITLATRVGLRVVAEGVEHDWQAQILLEMGCPTAQGFLFASAMTPDEFAAATTYDPASPAR